MVARPRSPDGNNVAITIKVSDRVAAALDLARGELTRSAWARATMAAALGTEAMAATEAPASSPAPRKPKPAAKAAAPVSPVPVAADRAAPALAEVRGLTVASALPRPSRCNHPGKRSVGGFCTDCDHLILTGGAWA